VLIVLDADERRSQPKLNQPTKGPYTITRVHTNGTVEIDRGRFVETINIRRLKPFYTLLKKKALAISNPFPIPFFMGENDPQVISHLHFKISK
jgi:hypothetical protein